jgi:hypothetical protein
MIYQKPVIAEIHHALQQLTRSQVWRNSADQDGQWNELARMVTDLYQREDYDSVRSVFERLEQTLTFAATTDVRSWVTGFLQCLQDVTTWRSSNIDIFVRFLGTDTRRIWETLIAIRSDLASCSILEAEVLMWRVVHHQPYTHRDNKQLS